jgi:hypothetical protein
MMPRLRTLATAGGLLVAILVVDPALAQKPGGALQVAHRDSPARVFDNLVIFDQHVPRAIIGATVEIVTSSRVDMPRVRVRVRG